jgi:hypothetical protein
MRDHKKWDKNWFDPINTAGDCQGNLRISGSSENKKILINTKIVQRGGEREDRQKNVIKIQGYLSLYKRL